MQKSIGFIFAIFISFTIMNCGEPTIAQEPTINAKVEAKPKVKAAVEKVTEIATEPVAKIKEEIKEVEKKAAKKTAQRKVEAPQEFKKEVADVTTKSTPKKVTKIAETPKPKAKKKKKSNGPIIKFAETSHKFGIIEEGGQVNHKFFFENSGKGDLFIKDATATCGCTVPSYPKTPIRTGETSYIRISFNTKEKTGAQKPVVTVYTNARKEPFKLYLEGEVIPKVGGNEEGAVEGDGH